MEKPKEQEKAQDSVENENSEHQEKNSSEHSSKTEDTKAMYENKENKKESFAKREEISVEEKTPEHKHEHKKETEHKTKHEEHKHHVHKAHAHKEYDSKPTIFWPILSAILLLAVVVLLVEGNFFTSSSSNMLNEDQIKAKAQEFINTKLLQPGTTATITNVELKNGIYKVELNVNGQTFESGMTTDGKVFFAQPGLDVDKIENAPDSKEKTTQPSQDIQKTDKPEVDLYVMSYCPYGTQIEKGILPVVDLLGDKANVNIKFVNYAMHGKKEVDENLRQYCIQQKYPDNYYAYLQCFLKKGDSPSCIEEQGFDKNVLDECTASADKQFGITADFEDKSSWSGGRYPKFAIYDAENQKYGVRGSPTLIINGKQVNSARDSNSLKNTICDAFTTKPEECNTDLPTASPSPGFGFGESATDSAAANCGG